MDQYFQGLMNAGRCAEQPVIRIFANDRRYFDQILYKNLKFRQAYAAAFQAWAAKQGVDSSNRHELFPQRLEAGIRYTGTEKVADLFTKLLELLKTEFPAIPLPPDAAYQDTLPGGALDKNPAYAAPMERIRIFWTRLALPEVWDE